MNSNKKFKILYSVFCTFLVFIFAVVLLFNYSYNTVYAANYAEGVVCSGFSFSNATSFTDGKLIVNATGTGGCNSSASTTKMTIKNEKSQAGTIVFDYTIDLQGGSVKINGNSITSNGHFELEVNSTSSFTVDVTSAADEKTTTITLANINSRFDINANITFNVADEGGSYKVSYGDVIEEITESIIKTINANNPITFTALPLTGYKIFCWEIETNGIKTRTNYLNDTFIQSFAEDTIIKPIFCSDSAAIFTTKAGGSYYLSLTEANNAAKNLTGNGKIIVPVGSNTIVPTGNYEISSGVTLLIPFDVNNTVYTTNPDSVYNSYVAPTAFKTLTLSSGVVISVSGSICVSSKLSAQGQGGGYNGYPTGQVGMIKMKNDSKIVLNSGSNLYCWGFISGDKNNSTGDVSGLIEAKSGSTVYESFKIRNWRGGGASSSLIGNKQKVFPLSSYYVQNIECSLKIYKGATENLVAYVNALSRAQGPANITFISTSDSMFKILGTSSNDDYILKKYNANEDRLVVEAHANVSLSKISMYLYVNIDSSDYVLPINDVEIIIKEGYTVSLGQDVAFLPDSKLRIEEGAILDVTGGKNIYVYDKDDWGNFTYTDKKMYPVGYSVANGTEAIRSDSKLKDAEIIINGLLQVSGGLYTTSHGANIYSEITYNSSNPNNGVIRYDNYPGTDTVTYQIENLETIVSVPITSAKLKNGSEYAGTADEFFETSTASSYDPGVRFVFQTQYNENYDPLPFKYNKWGIYNDIIFHTITYTDGTNHYNTQFREGGNYIFENYPNPDDPSAQIYTLNNDYKIKGWIVKYNNVDYFYGLGKINNNMSFTSDITAIAFYGGYVKDGDEVYYIDKGSETYESGLVKGLYRAKTQDGTSIEIMYFDLEDGHLIKNPSENIITFSGYYNNATYYIDNNGYVKNLNLLRKVVINGAEDFDISYYYFDENNQALKSGTYYINTSNSSLNINCEDLSVVLPSGYYTFDSEGRIIGVNGTGVFKSPTLDSYVEFDGTNFTIDGIKVAVGLVEISGDVYYIQDDFTVAKSKTVYVTKFYNTQSTYGIGLYYFGEDGKMISYKEVA